MTDFRARGTIMGLAGLTAVFGMGTGGAPPVSSPEFGREAVRPLGRGGSEEWPHKLTSEFVWGGVSSWTWPSTDRGAVFRDLSWAIRPGPPPFGGRGRSGVVKRSAVRTGRLRRSPAVHSRPIDLVVFQEPSSINRQETSS